MKRILLVYPRIPSTYWSFSHIISMAGFKSLMPPLGLLTVAALIPEGYEVTLVDMNVEPLTDRLLRAADMVMLSAMLVQKESFSHVVKRCRELGIPVAAGGPYPTACPDEMEDVDFLVLDEGESTIPLFSSDLSAGRSQRIYRATGRPDITLTPPPRYDLIKMNRYSTMALQASRGCPFNCEFCDIVSLYGRVPRYKTPEQFAGELDILHGTGFRGPVFIVDDNFIGNIRRVTSLLETILSWQEEHGFPFTFFTEASINLADRQDVLDLMERSGFNMVFIGIETPSRESLLSISKNQNASTDMADAVMRIQEKGIEVLGGFIVGFDEDRPDIFRRQIDFITEAAIPVAMVGLLQAFPGTRLWQRMEGEGRLRHVTSGDNTADSMVNFIPMMTEEVLRRGFRRIVSTIYRPSEYYERCRRLVERLPDSQVPGGGIRWWEVRAFIAALLRFAFSPYRRAFYSFLLWVILHHPRHFARAAGIGIKGYHFFRLTDAMMDTHEFTTQLDSLMNYMKRAFSHGTVPATDMRRVRRLARRDFMALPWSTRAMARHRYTNFTREIRAMAVGMTAGKLN